LGTKGSKSWDNHLKSLNSLFSFSTSSLESHSVSSSIGLDLNEMSRN
jgi:hypothetical protein